MTSELAEEAGSLKLYSEASFDFRILQYPFTVKLALHDILKSLNVNDSKLIKYIIY